MWLGDRADGRLDARGHRRRRLALPGCALVAGVRVTLQAVVFDVDFTIAKPGPDLGPEGYRALGRRFGLELDPALYDEARRRAIATLKRNPDLDHDEEVWVLFTERIIKGMGGSGDTYLCAREMTLAWERAD